MRAPSHATVVAYVALFLALGGSAYAATGGSILLGHANVANKTTTLRTIGTGPALKLASTANKPSFSVSNKTKIAKLNADELDGLDSTAFEGRSVKIASTITSATSGEQPAGKAGPWTFTFTCAPGGPAIFSIYGPGTAGGTTAVDAGSTASAVYVSGPTAIGTSFERAALDGEQEGFDLYLTSGAVTEHLDGVVTASNGGLFENCQVLGSASPVG